VQSFEALVQIRRTGGKMNSRFGCGGLSEGGRNWPDYRTTGFGHPA